MLWLQRTLVSHRQLLDEIRAALPGPDSKDRLKSTTIEHVVRMESVTISPETSLEAAASRMLALRIGCLPVVIPSTRGPQLVGLVTEADLLRAAYLPGPPGLPV
jgi:CBS domain-containing protein